MNVFQAAENRIATTFAQFDNVCVSFSGGKDSGVLLNLCADYIRKKLPVRKMGVFHIDYEAQYQMTTEYVTRQIDAVRDVADVYHCCMPISAGCATSMHQTCWSPWEKSKRDIWVRQPPSGAITEDNHVFDFFKHGQRDYDFQVDFGAWLHRHTKASNTACLVGIRTQESFNRWRALHADNNYEAYYGIHWTRKMSDGVYNVYPIFDWKTEDIWIANCREEWLYNKLYDIFHQAGLSIDQMRVSSPFHDQAIESLKMYRIVEPGTWGKLIGRVNGVNFSGIYGGTTAMGWKSIKLPPGHTWKSYMEFLLKSLPSETRDNYVKKLEVSKRVWRKAGGVMDTKTIEQLKAEGSPLICTGNTSTRGRGEKEVVRFDDYLDDTTADDFTRIPTYKRMCICIMKNDHCCKYMGFAPNKTELKFREDAERKYASVKS